MSLGGALVVESIDESAVGLAAWDALQQGVEHADPIPATGRSGWRHAYVELRGDTTPRGRHGHLGSYDRTLYLRAVTVVRAVPRDTCAVTGP